MAALLVDVVAVGAPAIGVGIGVSRLGLQGKLAIGASLTKPRLATRQCLRWPALALAACCAPHAFFVPSKLPVAALHDRLLRTAVRPVER